MTGFRKDAPDKHINKLTLTNSSATFQKGSHCRLNYFVPVLRRRIRDPSIHIFAQFQTNPTKIFFPKQFPANNRKTTIIQLCFPIKLILIKLVNCAQVSRTTGGIFQMVIIRDARSISLNKKIFQIV
jgi:hypothetical protein